MAGEMGKVFRRAQLEPEVAGAGNGILEGAGSAAHGGLDAIAAGMLGLIQGSVGGVQQFLHIDGGVGNGDTEAQADLHTGAADDDVASGDVAAHAFGEVPGVGEFAAGSYDEKLFAAAASHGIVRTDNGRDAAGDDAKNRVAGGVAAAVVDGLEVIHVDHDQADGLMIALGAEQVALQDRHDGFAVPQAGQAVAGSLAAERFLGQHQAVLRHQQARAGAQERQQHDHRRQSQPLTRNTQRHEQHQQRVEQIEQFGEDPALAAGRLQHGVGRLGLLPRNHNDNGNDQHTTPQQIKPCAGVQAASRAVIVQSVYRSGEKQKNSHAPKQVTSVAGAAERGPQNESDAHQSVARKVRSPDRV